MSGASLVSRRLQREAELLAALFPSHWARVFLRAGAALEAPGATSVYRERRSGEYLTGAEARRLSTVRRALVSRRPIATDFWSHAHGSFLAYARMLMLADPDPGGARPLPGRIVDFGCGAGAQLRALSACGVSAWGIECEPLFAALYDTWFRRLPACAPVWGAGSGARLVHGRFARDPHVDAVLPRGVELVLAKNVLKPGCFRIGPGHTAPMTDLGVPTARFLEAVRSVLRPRGSFAIYNLFSSASPRARSSEAGPPFSRRSWRRAGFELVAFEQDDTVAARAMARALRWPAAGDIRASLTFARKARR